jgi:hypothetical protein
VKTGWRARKTFVAQVLKGVDLEAARILEKQNLLQMRRAFSVSAQFAFQGF